MHIKRIAYIVNVFPKFSETFIANEIAELRRRGVEVVILSRRQPVETLRHRVVTDNGLEALAYYDESQFASVLSDFRPQLIHAHFATEPTELARKYSAMLGIPYSLTAHGYDVYRRPPKDFAERCHQASAVITVSDANARYMTDQLGASEGNLSVIPCGVDTAVFKPDSAHGNHDPLLVCVARMRPVKNLPMLLQACAILREQSINFRCVVLGDGADRPMLEEMRASLGLDSTVQFEGLASQEEVREWWRQASVGMLTSLSEGMPVSLMEAMSCGVPVVAPTVGGIPEMIKQGVNGFTIPINDAPALASSIRHILADQSIASQMSVEARKIAVNKFSLCAQVDKLIDIWNQVLHARQVA